MGKPKGSKGKKGGKGGGRGKGKVNAPTFYSAPERSQAYLVNAERVAAGLAPASIASICRSRRRSAARHAELNLAEIARRDEPTVDRPPPPKPPAPRRRVPPEESTEAPEGGAAPLEGIPDNPPEALGSGEDPRPWARRVRRRAERPSEPATPVDLVLRSVSRSASPSAEPGLCLKSRSPTPELSPRSELGRAVRDLELPSNWARLLKVRPQTMKWLEQSEVKQLPRGLLRLRPRTLVI